MPSGINLELVEVLEYALVIFASSILTAFSIGVYAGLGSAVGPAEDEATFGSVVAMARAAVEHGSSSTTLVFDHASVGCGLRTLTFSTERYSQNSSLPVDCSIPPLQLSGARELTFDYSEGLLTLQVR